MPIIELAPIALRNLRTRPVVAVIQARMGSTRLPGKVLKEICSRPILSHVVERVASSRLIDKVVVATTTDAYDDGIVRWCESTGTAYYRGSPTDVLERYYRAAVVHNASTIVRITADCPLVEPRLIDEAIKRFRTDEFDHVSVGPSHPDGLDAEVFSFKALEKAHKEAFLPSEREHVTPYIWKNPELFRLHSIECEQDLSSMRWTVDDEKDFKLVSAIFEALHTEGSLFHMDDILAFLLVNPELALINAGTGRNEGYAKSLKEDAAESAV